MKKILVCLCLAFAGVNIFVSCDKQAKETQVTKAASQISALSDSFLSCASFCDSLSKNVDKIDDHSKTLLENKREALDKSAKELEDNYSFINFKSHKFEIKYKAFDQLSAEEKAGAVELISAIAKVNSVTDSCSTIINNLTELIARKSLENSLKDNFVDQLTSDIVESVNTVKDAISEE